MYVVVSIFPDFSRKDGSDSVSSQSVLMCVLTFFINFKHSEAIFDVFYVRQC